MNSITYLILAYTICIGGWVAIVIGYTVPGFFTDTMFWIVVGLMAPAMLIFGAYSLIKQRKELKNA